MAAHPPHTVVLSGPAQKRPQVVSTLRQLGFEVDDSEHRHGFEPTPDESFITAHSTDLDAVSRAVEPFGWGLRSHWARTSAWSRAVTDPVGELRRELAELKALLRAQGKGAE